MVNEVISHQENLKACRNIFIGSLSDQDKKELVFENEIMACETPSLTFDVGKVVCTSKTGNAKVIKRVYTSYKLSKGVTKYQMTPDVTV